MALQKETFINTAIDNINIFHFCFIFAASNHVITIINNINEIENNIYF